MAAINFPTATSNGQTFTADTGVIYTYIGTPPNGFWSGTFGTTGLATLDGRFVALNDGNSIQTMQTQGLKFNNGSADTILLDGVNGKVGIGTTSASSFDSEANNLVVGDGTGDNGITIYTGTSAGNHGSIFFADGTGSSGAKKKGQIRYEQNNEVMSFHTNELERLRIDLSGNIGIGTASPSTQLHVVETGAYSAITASSNVATTGLASRFALGNSVSTARFTINMKGGGGEEAYLGSEGNFPIYFQTHGSERLRIDSSGNVGIGNSAPAAKLHLEATSEQLRITHTSVVSYRHEAHSNGDYSINKDGNERLRINSSGNVGIGTSGATEKLEIQNGSISVGSGTNTTTTNTLIAGYGYILNTTKYGNTSIRSSYNNSNNSASLDFYVGTSSTATSEAMRIDSSGRLLLGTSSIIGDAADDSYYAKLTILGRGDAAGNGARIAMLRDETTANVSAGNEIGNFIFGDKSGGTYAAITSYATGNASLNNYPGELKFYTNGGTEYATERMKIDSSGNLLINETTNQSNNAVTQIKNTTTRPTLALRTTIASGCFMLFQNPTSGYTTGRGLYVGGDSSVGGYLWLYEAGPLYLATSGTSRMQISSGGKVTAPGVYSGTTTGGGPVYVESDGDLLRYTSSLKYKTDVETIEDARADAILNCRPVWYRSKCANDIKTEGAEKSDWGWYGFIAEELAEIEPRLVNWATKDAVVQEDGKTKSVERDPANYEAEGVRYENFVPLLLNLVKRQQSVIQTLEPKVAALESDDGPFTVKQPTSLLNNPFASFLNSNGDTAGSIIQNGINSVTYATSSDYRLKDNVVDLSAAIPRLKQLVPKRFNFKADADVTVDGFLAHEAQVVVPEAVTGTHNQLDGNGNAIYQGIDQSKLVPLLTAALQEAIGRIETLETEVAALKAG